MLHYATILWPPRCRCCCFLLFSPVEEAWRQCQGDCAQRAKWRALLVSKLSNLHNYDIIAQHHSASGSDNWDYSFDTEEKTTSGESGGSKRAMSMLDVESENHVPLSLRAPASLHVKDSFIPKCKHQQQ